MQAQFMLIHHIAGDPVLFINGQANMAKSRPEDGRYLCRFHPRNEIFNAFV
jgi:hypothetical protein